MFGEFAWRTYDRKRLKKGFSLFMARAAAAYYHHWDPHERRRQSRRRRARRRQAWRWLARRRFRRMQRQEVASDESSTATTVLFGPGPEGVDGEETGPSPAHVADVDMSGWVEAAAIAYQDALENRPEELDFVDIKEEEETGNTLGAAATGPSSKAPADAGVVPLMTDPLTPGLRPSTAPAVLDGTVIAVKASPRSWEFDAIRGGRWRCILTPDYLTYEAKNARAKTELRFRLAKQEAWDEWFKVE